MSKMPLDRDGNPIPALALKEDGAHTISVSATSARNAVAFNENTRVISVYATVDVYLKFSEDSTVTATSGDHFFPANTYYDIAIGGNKTSHKPYLAALRVNSDGTLYISEKA